VPSRLQDPSLQRRTLESLTHAPNYNRWIAGLVFPFLGDDPLEVGSGLGDFAELWLAMGTPRITVSELEPEDVTQLCARFGDDERVDVRQLDLGSSLDEAGTHSAVVLLNVLEHIEDDTGAVAAAARLVRPFGAVIVFSPAHPWAMSKFDRAIGHWRRYTQAELRSVLADAGLEADRVKHVNAPGLLAWALVIKLLHRTPTDTGALRVYDRLVIPFSCALERRLAPPFGQSLLAVGRVRR
jgi:SAM-dependent methyltransferase